MNNPSILELQQQLAEKDQQIAKLEAKLAAQNANINECSKEQNNCAIAKSYLDEVLRNLPLGIAILEGPEYNYYRINQYLADIYNLSADQHLGRPIKDVQPQYAQSITPILKKVYDTGLASEKREFTIEHDNGQTKQLVDFHFPIGHNAILSMVLDITERKTMIQAVSRSKQELERNIETLKDTQHQLVQTAKLASIGQLTAGLAHELNQPMSRIFLTAEMIGNIINKKGEPNIERVNELLTRIIRDVHSASALMDHLRMYSRQDVSSVYEPIDLSDLIDQLMILFDHQIKILAIDFTLDLQHQQQQLHGDPGQIEQVINNLMSNAIDALKNKQTKTLSLRTFEQGDFTCIEVSDSGCGMSKSVVNNMFDPFFTTKESGKGTGLGLSISKGIIENHDGIFNVQSSEGQGTTIRVSLPRNKKG